jgi:hypothetical protein
VHLAARSALIGTSAVTTAFETVTHLPQTPYFLHRFPFSGGILYGLLKYGRQSHARTNNRRAVSLPHISSPKLGRCSDTTPLMNIANRIRRSRLVVIYHDHASWVWLLWIRYPLFPSYDRFLHFIGGKIKRLPEIIRWIGGILMAFWMGGASGRPRGKFCRNLYPHRLRAISRDFDSCFPLSLVSQCITCYLLNDVNSLDGDSWQRI